MMVNSNQPNYPWPVIAGVALLILFLVFGIPGLFFGILIWIKNIICDSFLFFWDFGIEKYQNEQYLLAFISFFFLILVFGSILKLLGVLINYLFGRRSIQNGDVNTERGNIIPSIGSIFGKFELPKLGSNTTFWILLLFAAFTFRYWGGYFGGSIGTGAREAGVNFFNGLTGKIDPKSLEIQRPLKNQNGDYEFCPSEEWLEIYWPADEYMMIKLCTEGKLENFYLEAEKALEHWSISISRVISVA
jgi:hypothetical protein